MKEPLASLYLNGVVYLSLWPLLIQKLISAPLAVNILNYLCFWKKAGLFTKFVDTFFLFVGEELPDV